MMGVPAPVITTLMPFQFLSPRIQPEVPVSVTVAVLAVTVRFVEVRASQAPSPVAETEIALAPNVNVRAVDPDVLRLSHEHVCPLVFSVPVVNVILPVNVVPALCRSVRSDLLMVMEAADRATSTVTVAAVPELESKVTLSPATGTVSPPAPPVVADQWAVSPVLPVPSTQNLLAMVA